MMGIIRNKTLKYWDIIIINPYKNILSFLSIVKFKLNINYSSSFLITFVLGKLEGLRKEEANDIASFVFSMATLSLIGIISFIYAFGYIIALYLIPKFELDKKYPKLKRMINFYEKASIYFISLDIFAIFIVLLIIFILNVFIYINI